MMRAYVGTSGYSYDAWKGSFYPKTLNASGMLAHYATKLPVVEINHTFRKAPTAETCKGWAERVPVDFRFVLKAPASITMRKDLDAAGDALVKFVAVARTLGRRLGPLLLQLPPKGKKDMARLEALLKAASTIRPRPRLAFELRDPSWASDDVYAVLRRHKATLCIAETDDAPAFDADELAAPIVKTADWGYVRLRRTDYSVRELAAWAARLRAQDWSEVYVFLKHEDEGKGPRFAMRLRKILESGA
jgi:uncharacterized protein YecE (DUF72 family)